MSSHPAHGRAATAILLAAGLMVAGAAVWLLLAPEVAAPPELPSRPPVAPAPAAAPAAPAPVRAAPAAPTASFVVIDAGHGTPLPGAALHRLDNGERVATADGQGRCQMATAPEVTLVAVARDHLLRLCPTPLAVAEDRPLPLQADASSRRVRFCFRGDDGRPIGPVQARVRRLESIPLAAAPRAEDRAASLEHDMLAALPQLAFLRVVSSRTAVAACQLDAEATMRFCSAGRFELEVTTATGLAARTEFLVATGEDDAAAVEVRLAQALFASGTVARAADGQPLAAVQVRALDGDPMHLLAVTDAAGRFRLGPLPPGPLTLLLHAQGLASSSIGPFTEDLQDLRIAMQPLPPDSWRGRVSAQPDGAPLAAVEVQLVDADGATTTTRTDRDGDFAVPAAPGQARLSVIAPGYLRYVALVTPQREPLVCRLWPADPAARLAARATALLRGVAVDARGRPLRGVPVRFVSDAAATPEEQERPLLEGGLVLPQLTITAEDGSFAIETRAFGPGQLTLLHGAVPPMPLRLDVRGGAAHDDLLLRAPD